MMKLEKFNKIELPTIEEFLELHLPLNYDFSNDKEVTQRTKSGALVDYISITDSFEKFFAYMMVSKQEKFINIKEDNPFYPVSKEVEEKVNKCYGDVKDPDSKSQLLQQIYKVLWNEENILEDCKFKNGNIQGETLNSANTTIGKLYEFYEDEKDKAERKQNVSISYIIYQYLTRESNAINRLLETKAVENFVKTYHTLGNFMPVPVGCNGPRGFNNPHIEDYVDLTLLHIYNYYKENNYKELEYIVGLEFAKAYKIWLDKFDDGKNAWHNFVKKNYLQPFVKSKKEDYFPKELWSGHFNKSVLPENESECTAYFKNSRNWISKRGKSMIKKLGDEIK